MNRQRIDKIVAAVLYEGYILYPYRASSLKNRQRFNFGSLLPRAWCERHESGDNWMMRTECLVTGDQPTVEIEVRFLHLMEREIWRMAGATGDNGAIDKVAMLEVDDRQYTPWQECIERRVLAATDSKVQGPDLRFDFPGSRQNEPLADANGRTVGRIIRTQSVVAGNVCVQTERLEPGLTKLTVRIENQTPLNNVDAISRDQALSQSLASTHTLLSVTGGEFVSLLDPAEPFRAAAAGCTQMGTFPVLAGEEGERDVLLSSPIILYDHPQIAPQSPGSFFDGLEIDEILSLRVQSLTDEEKRQMRSVDEHARRILERTESLDAGQYANMHGVMRQTEPVIEESKWT